MCTEERFKSSTPLLYCYIIIFPILLINPARANQQTTPEDEKGIFNIIYENDMFLGQDQGYTDGIRAAWLSSEAHAPKWTQQATRFLPLASEGKKRISLAIGQNMFTPRDLSQRTPIPNDQPYAGWLYSSLGVVSDTDKTLDNIVLTVGIVGPLSYAGQTQKAVHHIVGSPHPEGWDNQLHNEVGINFTYERKWRNILQFSPFQLGFDASPAVGATVGNVNTNAQIGTTFRLGYDLPADYAPPRIRPSLPGSDFFIATQRWGGYLFSGIEGRAVLRNIFLDGNTFEDSMHVDKKFFIADIQIGLAVTYKNSRLSYTQVFMTKEFDSQTKAPKFSALTFSYRF